MPQISSNLLAHAQDEDLLVTEFSIIGHTSSSSSSGSTIGGSATSAAGFESRASTGSGSGSTELGKLFAFYIRFVWHENGRSRTSMKKYSIRARMHPFL